MLRNPTDYSEQFETLMHMEECKVFYDDEQNRTVLLENGYAQYRFKNPGEWPPQGQHVRPTAVQVIFTKYPKDKEFWLTDYHWLLSKRLLELFSLDSNLNSEDVDYSMLLQTDCDNEFETIQLFHGIRIWYEPIPQEKEAEPEESAAQQLDDEPHNTTTACERNRAHIKKLNQWMYKDKHSMDSSVFNVLDRHREWDSCLMVVDFTGSMYGYGAEAVLWQLLNEDSSGITHCAFFNDGDGVKTRKKVLGNTGGVYVEKTAHPDRVLRAMRKTKNRGNGGDSPENDMEAMASSLLALKNTEEVVLIADNKSCIRDFVLLTYMRRPVHVILCGTEAGINHQYINLAWLTGGSIHTKDMDLDFRSDSVLQSIQDEDFIVAGVEYTLLQNGYLMPLNLAENFFAHCDRYYNATGIRSKRKKKRHKEPDCYFTQ